MSPDMMYNLHEGIQADVPKIATRFREIDMFVLCEFRDGHGVVPNPNISLEDLTDLDLMKHRDFDVSDFPKLCKTHDEDDILPYLGDQRLKEFWWCSTPSAGSGLAIASIFPIRRRPGSTKSKISRVIYTHFSSGHRDAQTSRDTSKWASRND
ncbi:hypothetical protein LTR17_010890 [Elasticomyces elasticus]|nr:hypothetical protein LTR17_010890 [Elasticomyces elasticus]